MRTRFTRQALLVALVGAASFNAPALAMGPDDDEQAAVNELFSAIDLDNDADQDAQVAEQTSQHSSVQISSMEGGHEILIDITDGEISGTVDHKKLDPDQIERKDGKIIILDDDGNEIAQFETSTWEDLDSNFFKNMQGGKLHKFPAPPPAPPNAWGGAGKLPGLGGQWNTQTLPATLNPPAVMIGLMMGEPGESLMAHFDLEPGEAIMVTGTVDDLPADEAGLVYGDLITEIDGESPATQQTLHEALAELEDGDTLDLTVIHKGRERDVQLEVVAYDAEALAMGNEIEEAAPEMFRRFNLGDNNKRAFKFKQEDLQRKAEEFAARLQAKAGDVQDREHAIQLFVEQLADAAGDETGRQLKLRVTPDFGGGVQEFLVPDGIGNNWNGDLEDRLDSLQDEVEELSDEFEERLEERLGRLEDMLDRLMERLDRENDHGDRRRRGHRDDE